MMNHGPQPVAAVGGVALQPGERVIYEVRPDFSSNKTAMLVLGIMFLLVVVGVFFLFAYGRIDKRNPRLLVVTSQRAIVVQGTGEVFQWWLQDIAELSAIRFKSRYRADKLPSSHPGFWQLATGMVVSTRRGESTTVSCEDRPKEIWEFGLFLARVLERGTAEGFPVVRRGV